MKTSRTCKLALSAFALALLAACGGGGGGGSGGAASTTVSGVAAKGLLANAKVSIFEIGANGPGATALATTTTDAKGQYSLSITPTSNPILVVIEAVSGTKMLDETQVVNGEFKQVDAPAGLVLRSMALNASTGTVTLSANPYTEAAVQAAATARDSANNPAAWSSNAISAGLQLASQLVPQGVNPFAVRPTNLTDLAGADAAQTQMLMSLAGFMQKAASCVNDGATVTAADITCELDRLRNLATVVVGANSSTVTEAAGLSTWRQQVFDAAVTVTAAVPQLAPLAPLATTAQLNPVPVPGTVESAATYTAKASLESFVSALSAGFRATESELMTARTVLDQRYANVVLNGADATIDALNSAVQECDYAAGSGFYCPGWTNANGTWSRTVASSRINGAVVEQVISGSSNGTGTYSVSYTGVQKLNGTTLSRGSFTISVAGLDEYGQPIGTSVTSTLNGTVTAYDANASGITATLALENLTATLTEGTPYAISGSGTVRLSSSAGDSFGGTVTLSGKSKDTANGSVAELTSLVANLRATVQQSSATDVATLTVTAADSPNAFSGIGYDTFSMKVDATLVGGTTLVMQMSKATAGQVDATATVNAGGQEVVFGVVANAATGRYCYRGDTGQLCGNTLTIRSKDGAYTAELTGDATTGSIINNGVQVGTLTRSSVSVNGREYSFY